ncbi:hypothetical protein IT409_00760, partial [Candidatus Falkowbacteria bacterium]|nr:hypothetical protein [Candidatus Falkowbacteria bacterium]
IASLSLSQIIGLGTGILAVVYFTTIAHVAIILEVKNRVLGKKSTLTQSFVHAHSHILDVITLSLLGRIALALSVLIAAIPVAFSYALSEIATMYIAVVLFVLLYIPLSVIISLSTNYAVISNVFDENDFFRSIKTGFKTFKQNALVSVEMLIALALLQLFVYLVIVSLAGLVFIPISATLSSVLFVGQSALFGILLSLVIILCVAICVFLLGWYQVTYTSALCVAYYGMNHAGFVSKLYRVLESGIKNVLGQAPSQQTLSKVTQTVDDASDNLLEVLDEVIEYFESVKVAQKTKPMLQKTSRQMMSDIDSLVEYAMPMIEEGFEKIQKKVKKSKPYINKIKETIENTYIKELEDELGKLFAEESDKKQVARNKRKTVVSKRKSR